MTLMTMAVSSDIPRRRFISGSPSSSSSFGIP